MVAEGAYWQAFLKRTVRGMYANRGMRDGVIEDEEEAEEDKEEENVDGFARLLDFEDGV